MGLDLGRFRSKNDEKWDDWLSDDPVPATFRDRIRFTPRQQPAQPQTTIRRAGKQPVSRPVVSGPTPRPASVTSRDVQKHSSAAHSLSINISFPKLKKPTLPKKLSDLDLPKLPKNLTYKQLGIGSGALLLVLVVGGIALNQHGGKKTPGSTGVLSASSQKADFAYSLPSGSGHTVKAEDVRYDSTRKVVNYKDSIGGIEITISQQPLPDGFKEDTQEKVKKLAEGFSATKTIATANPTAYIGTSVKGPQTVIFSKKDLLVFIQSTKVIDDHDWAEYVTNLK